MSHIPKVMNAFARLLCYPGPHTPQAAELLFVVLSGEVPEAAEAIVQFGAFVEQHEAFQIEEAFTGTFDVNPACALEVGWHLFGEEYARGMFLVRMRQEMRNYGIAESPELPDHISHVLAVVAAMPEDKASAFVTACVRPAVLKMNEALAEKDTPYRHVIACLSSVITQKWGAGAVPAREDLLAVRSGGADPLHAFPVADAGCGDACSGDCAPDLVALEVELPGPPREDQK